jgi:hypothetical protein
MIKNHFMLITAACLVWTGVLFAGTSNPGENDSERLKGVIESYHKEGYIILGPVQYLGKTNKQIYLYRQQPVPYTRLRVRNLMGVITALKAQNYVYVFTKDSSVVLLRLEKEFENEE